MCMISNIYGLAVGPEFSVHKDICHTSYKMWVMFDTQTRLDDAVSPVVGVILMVAVTVILAAVIGSFVLDLGNNVQANPQAGVTFDEDASNNQVIVQIVSMENADKVTVSASSGNGFTYSDTSDMDSVGETATLDTGGTDGKITVVGHLEGKEAVLQTYTYEHA